MDRRERGGDQRAGILAALAGLQASIWTALPGIVQSFDAAKRTCVVQPTLQANVQAPDGSKSWVTLPLLLDCPVVFPGGGGFVLTFPLAEGDECLVVFASRCIDAWWQSGGIQVQAELRMHDLSDGFVIPGPRSAPAVEPGISTSAVQLRSTDGSAFIEIDPGGNVAITAPGDVTATAGGSISATAGSVVTIEAPTINLIGDVNLQGNFAQTGGNATMSGSLTTTGQVKAAGIPLSTHKHTGVTAGGATSGGPTP